MDVTESKIICNEYLCINFTLFAGCYFDYAYLMIISES